jgi:hypothetical protein
MQIRVAVRDNTEHLVKEFAGLFGQNRVSRQAGGEIVVELGSGTNDAIDKALRAIERWLVETGVWSAIVWVGDRSYMLERPGQVTPELRATLVSLPRNTSSNGALFNRTVNNGIYDVLAKLDVEDGEFWCECDSSCEERVTLTLREYAALRDRQGEPLLSRSHVLPQDASPTDSAHV